MRVLHPADHQVQPWANGRGVTTQILRIDRDGALLARLSMATVAEDGPFSIFPGIERNLTVLSGPGFRLVGADLDLMCAPLVPVAFPGDVPVAATGTAGQPSVDFNVMTARSLPKPDVMLAPAGSHLAAGGKLALLALETCRANGETLVPHAVALCKGEVHITGGHVLAVRLFGLD